MAQRTFFGTVRLAALLAVLVFVTLGAWLDRARSRDWNEPLRVTIYPLPAPGSAAADHIASLQDESFAAIEAFFEAESGRFGIDLAHPVRVRVSRAATGTPPLAPGEGGPLAIAAWSLKMRYWAWRVQAEDPLPPPDIQIFALYHDSTGEHALPDSVGLSTGLMVLAHVYADRAAQGENNVVLAHELLHTLGASDKYDAGTGQPRTPEGLGEPLRQPRYPQNIGEIMAGRIALGPEEATMPASLQEMRVGALTADEIGWR